MKTPAFLPVSLLSLVVILAAPGSASAAEKHYELTIRRQEMSPTGNPVSAITVNGGIPAPVVRFTEGDTAVMVVRNELDEPSSIHWHGVLLPPQMDGVPGISFPPIRPGETFTYRFPIRQKGTYWYHSHSGLQEQRGLFGAIVIEPKARDRGADRDHVIVLSDWTEREPDQVIRLLWRGSEYMAVQKKSAQSMLGAFKTNKLGEFWKREAMRMPSMDLSDVAYDGFLTNGKLEETLAAKPGETIRLRIVDGAASTFFHMQWAGGPMTIVSADGQPVEPVKWKKPLLIGVAETYDVLVTVPSSGAWEFRSTAHDGSGHTSLWIGQGERHSAPDMPKPYLYDTMDMFGWKEMFALTPGGSMGMPDREVHAGKFDQPGMNMKHMMKDKMDDGGSTAGNVYHGELMESGMPEHDGRLHEGQMGGMHSMKGMEGGGVTDNPPRWYDFLLREDIAQYPRLADDGMMAMERPWNPYKKLRAVKDTSLPADAPRRVFRLTLDGDMKRFVWSLNNQPLSPNDNLHIREGEVVRFIMINRTMMHHPMHLHGHFFRVINGQGRRSPLKHTVNVPPMMTTVIEFEATEPGDWFFHCHLLYHLESGMARVVKYDQYVADAATVASRDEVLYHRPYRLFAMVDLLTNETQGEIHYRNLMNTFGLDYEAGWDGVTHTEWEADFTYERYLNRFSSVFVGVYGEGSVKDWDDWKVETERLIAGVNYLLPLNIWSVVWLDSDGGGRVSIERELMLTPRLGIFGEVEYDTHEEWSYQAGASYLLTPNLAITSLWDSTYGVGAGVTLRY